MFRIKELRKEQNLSMADVARELNMPYTTYVNYEKENREPNSEVLIIFADYFNCTVDYLIGRSEIRVNHTQTNSVLHDKQMEILVDNYNTLDTNGKNKLLEYSNDLINSGNYNKSSTKEEKLA